MLEKIGLPPKPSMRGNNWVVDATHCQGCSSQFTFINRKHHCRRCGGLFCSSCTQQRMVLRGQGDSPVRICEPCKKLEEAARFEMRHGHKNRTGRGGSKAASMYDDEALNQILGNDGNKSFSSGRESTNDMFSSIQRAKSNASCSNIQAVTTHDEGGDILKSLSVEEPYHLLTEMGSSTPEDLRQQALDEKNKYKLLKAEGKSEEALRAFKRGKELERQAGALDIYLRKSRKKALSASNMTEIQENKDDVGEYGRKNKLSSQKTKEKDDIAAELRDLGWSDLDLHDADKKPRSVSLEGELSTLFGELSQKANAEKGTHGIDKSQIMVHKKRALALKREGNLAEAKEELKRAKVLEKQIEEQEFLAAAEDSDEEFSALLRSIDSDKQDELSSGYGPNTNFDFDHLVGIADDLGVDSNFEVADDDMDDPEIAAALTSLGWPDDTNQPMDTEPQFVSIDREALLSEIQSLKREALNQKRAGNTVNAVSLLKKAKILERDLDSSDSQGTKLMAHTSAMVQEGSVSQSAEKPSEINPVDVNNVIGTKDKSTKLAPRSKLMIQKELLNLKKRALALRREGRLDEADEELKKGKVLEQQLEEINNVSNVKVTQVNINSTALDIGDDKGDVTDQDMRDPTYLSLLKNLGWKEEDNEVIPSQPSVQTNDSSVTGASTVIQVGSSRRSKGEIQRELLGLKRKSLVLRRQGEVDGAEEVLKMARLLEAQLAEIEAPKMKEAPSESSEHRKNATLDYSQKNGVDEGDESILLPEDMHDPALLSMLKNIGWKDEVENVAMQANPMGQVSSNPVPSDVSLTGYTPEISGAASKRSKAEIQKELLSLKRKALAHRRKGETEEAEEVLRMTKILEVQMEELQAPKNLPVSDASKHEEAEFGPVISNENNGNLKDIVDLNKGTIQAPIQPNNKVVVLPEALGRKESNSAKPSRSSDSSVPEFPMIFEDHQQLLVDLGPPVEMKTAGNTGAVPPTGQSANIMDLLTGDSWGSSQTSLQNIDDKRNFSSVGSTFANVPGQMDSQRSPPEDFGSKQKALREKREANFQENKKPQIDESNSARVSIPLSDRSSIQQDILARKKKAVSLKREGKLAEAKEELRQAKLLEKCQEENNSLPATASSDVSSSNVVSVVQKEQGLKSAPKPLSSRDRFKLQQESLSHKRQALKLRREGRTEEAEAEFELAKALESQLEELAAHDMKSSSNAAEPADDVGVEDFLDPQLLSALKAIGLDDDTSGSRGPERTESVKPITSKIDNSSEERIQLEEQIKAEKVKAVNLKRSGKQAEALDALRRAKLYEKKLKSLAS
ncbi:unnamed protein product [Ilex paraguariensis]|uniref:FYVE-type domain-containing protein n=1 Tax=Ilex paraguariensis TaxID=185542 RepID=A0ABC8RCD3_9AQUA